MSRCPECGRKECCGASMSEENADLRAQLAARDAEIAAMWSVVKTSVAYFNGDDCIDEWYEAVREYESKVTK